MSDLARVCSQCGDVFECESNSSMCIDCRPKTSKDYKTKAQRGYDYSWDKLSRKARKKQPFCSDCGNDKSLQLDHSPEAWLAHEQGRPITLDMCDVVCAKCNVKRGRAKGDDPTWKRPRDIRDLL